MTVRHWFARTGNRFGVWLYRSLDGRLSSGRRDVTVLLLTAPGRHLVARPRVLEGEERDRTWREVVLVRAPEVRRYAERAGRTIPVACLVPVPGG